MVANSKLTQTVKLCCQSKLKTQTIDSGHIDVCVGSCLIPGLIAFTDPVAEGVQRWWGTALRQHGMIDGQTKASNLLLTAVALSVRWYSGTTDVVDLVRLTSPTKTAIIEMRM